MKYSTLMSAKDFNSSFISCEKDLESILRKLFIDSRPYSDNLKITYGPIVMYPIRPLTRNTGESKLNEVIILAATKK